MKAISLQVDREVTRNLGSLRTQIIDFDAFPNPEQAFRAIQTGLHDLVLVVWYPQKYSASEAARFSRRLVDAGATLIDRATGDQPFEERVDSFVEDFYARKRVRTAIKKANPAEMTVLVAPKKLDPAYTALAAVPRKARNTKRPGVDAQLRAPARAQAS